jgi:hypothetical protein
MGEGGAGLFSAPSEHGHSLACCMPGPCATRTVPGTADCHSLSPVAHPLASGLRPFKPTEQWCWGCPLPLPKLGEVVCRPT